MAYGTQGRSLLTSRWNYIKKNNFCFCSVAHGTQGCSLFSLLPLGNEEEWTIVQQPLLLSLRTPSLGPLRPRAVCVWYARGLSPLPRLAFASPSEKGICGAILANRAAVAVPLSALPPKGCSANGPFWTDRPTGGELLCSGHVFHTCEKRRKKNASESNIGSDKLMEYKSHSYSLNHSTY